MYLSTVALCTWHCDKLVLRTCTFPTYSEFFVSVCCSPSAALLLRGSWQPRLTSTVLKRCSSSSSGGIGSLTPLVWPVEPGGADATFPSFPAGASMLPAAFPISGYPIDPRNTHTNKNCSKEAAEKVNKCSVSSCLQLMFCEARDLSLFPWPRSVDPCWSSSHDSSIFSNKEKAGGWNPPVPLSEILVHYETLERGKGISWEWRTEWQLSEWKRKKGGGDRVQSLSLCTHNTRLQEDRKKKRKINKKRFHFWVPLCSGEWIKKKKKLWRKLLQELQSCGVVSVSRGEEALHLLLDAGSLRDFDLHVPRRKRKRGAGRDPAGSRWVYSKQGQRDRERGGGRLRHQLTHRRAQSHLSSLGPNASMFRAPHFRHQTKESSCSNANSGM